MGSHDSIVKQMFGMFAMFSFTLLAANGVYSTASTFATRAVHHIEDVNNQFDFIINKMHNMAFYPLPCGTTMRRQVFRGLAKTMFEATNHVEFFLVLSLEMHEPMLISQVLIALFPCLVLT